MIKITLFTLLLSIVNFVLPPEVKVSGAMRNIMMEGDLSAHINLDTLDKTHLYGLGPVADLKGEVMILDGKVFTSTKEGNKLINLQDKVSKAAMLVYSRVDKWKTIELNTKINSYKELEKLVQVTAKDNGYDIEVPFTFKIETQADSVNYHVIDWKKGSKHTMENHMKYVYNGYFFKQAIQLLGFYSTHHQSIYTHHTTFMHVHVMDLKTNTVGHLSDIKINGPLKINFSTL